MRFFVFFCIHQTLVGQIMRLFSDLDFVPKFAKTIHFFLSLHIESVYAPDYVALAQHKHIVPAHMLRIC
jgi:hypothetical protein